MLNYVGVNESWTLSEYGLEAGGVKVETTVTRVTAQNSSAVVIRSQRTLGFVFDMREKSCPFTLT